LTEKLPVNAKATVSERNEFEPRETEPPTEISATHPRQPENETKSSTVQHQTISPIQRLLSKIETTGNPEICVKNVPHQLTE
jgi:hypothetical protein